jgi:hypothetical protein
MRASNVSERAIWGPTHGKVQIREGWMYVLQWGQWGVKSLGINAFLHPAVRLAVDCSPFRKVTGDMCGYVFYCFCASWPVSLRPIPGGFGQAGRHGRGLYKVLVGPLPSTLSSGRTQVHERLVGK